jgi:hypothetical protein
VVDQIKKSVGKIGLQLDDLIDISHCAKPPIFSWRVYQNEMKQ